MCPGIRARPIPAEQVVPDKYSHTTSKSHRLHVTRSFGGATYLGSTGLKPSSLIERLLVLKVPDYSKIVELAETVLRKRSLLGAVNPTDYTAVAELRALVGTLAGELLSGIDDLKVPMQAGQGHTLEEKLLLISARQLKSAAIDCLTALTAVAIASFGIVSPPDALDEQVRSGIAQLDEKLYCFIVAAR